MNTLDSIDTRYSGPVLTQQVVDGRIVYAPPKTIPPRDDSRMGSTIDWDAIEEENRRNRLADAERRKRKGIKTIRELGGDCSPIRITVKPDGSKRNEQLTVCPVCHREFLQEQSEIGRLRIFCSEECRRKEFNRRKRELYAAKRAAKEAQIERANEKTTERGMCECPECGGLFFPRKQGRAQKFCCHTCAQRAANRRYRERHGC